MSFHVSPVFSALSMFIPLIVAFLLWRKIGANLPSLGFPEKERKSILTVSGILLFGGFAFSIAVATLDLYHVHSKFFSPLVPIATVIPGIAVLYLIFFSNTTKKIVDSLPQPFLISLQLYRVLGIVFLWQMEAGKLPAMFAIPAAYGDMITGIAAPIVALIYLKKIPFSKILAILWNVFGVLDLVMSITLGVLLAFPAPFQVFPVTLTTETMTIFPMVLVPVYAVPLGFIMHVFSLRGLLKGK